MAAQNQMGVVSATRGEVFARNADGQMRRLAVGDPVFEKDTIVTANGSNVEITSLNGSALTVAEQQTVLMDEQVFSAAPDPNSGGVSPLSSTQAAQVIQTAGNQDFNQQLDEEAAAAGLTGGGDGAGHSFVQLLRITEGVDGVNYGFPINPTGAGPRLLGAAEDDEPTAGDLTINLDEDDISYQQGTDVREVAWYDAFVSAVGIPAGYYDNGNNDLADGDDGDRFSPTTLSGTLNLDYGNSGPGSLVFNPATALLTSSGETVQYWLSADGHTLVGYISEDGFQFPPKFDSISTLTQEGGDYSFVKVIFAAEITDVALGGFSFTQYGPLDHETNSTEDNLVIPFSFTVTDGNGDAAVGTLTVNLDDDLPAMRDAFESATVDEDDIRTDLSQGTSPNDGDRRDGSFTGDPQNAFDSGPANVWGSVASLVTFGADGPGDNPFSLAKDLSGLEEQGLTSKGESLSYTVVGNILYGFVSEGEEGEGDSIVYARDSEVSESPVDGRVVFTLQLESDGDYQFSLFDQLDHDTVSQEPSATFTRGGDYGDDSGQNNLPIDLSSVIVATDYDGDALTLDSGFVINVTDDVPEEAGILPVVGFVEEEALKGGNQENGDVYPDTTVATGSLASQVEVGADESVTFSFSDDFSDLPSLKSNGEPVTYRLDGDTLVAEVSSEIEARAYSYDATGDEQGPPPARVVFTLQLDEDGDYRFELLDQLDHSRGDGENWKALDFSSIIVATDADGDSITLNEDFYIKVVDDVPVVGVSGPTSVSEEAAAITGTWDVSMGADQPGSTIKVMVNGSEYNLGDAITVVESDWWASGSQNVGTLTVNAGGIWTFDPNPNLDNLDNMGWLGDWARDTQFSFSIKATDSDGDTVSDSQTINVLDGVSPLGGDSAALALDEEALGNAGATGTNPTSGAEEATGTISFTAGSDDLISFRFGSLGNLLRSTDGNSGPELSWLANSAGTTVTGYFAGTSRVAITLNLEAPSSITNGTSGTVTVTATLSDNLKHSLAGGEQVLDLGSIRIYAGDHDGDSTFGTVSLSVKDDVPVIESQSIQILSESFENFANTAGWTVVGEGGGTITGNNGILWNVNAAGIEIQTAGVGGSQASDGNFHAELDAHNILGGNPNTLTTLWTEVALPSSVVTLTFDYKPRPADRADSDMKVKLNGVELTLDSDSAGVVTINPASGVTASQALNANGWTTVTLTFTGLDTSVPATLSFEGLSSTVNGNSLGAYLDNINLSASTFGLTVDETVLTTDATADFSQFFAHSFSYGADGPGALTYGLGLNTGPTGLVDTATGQEVLLRLNAGMVEGYVTGVTTPVFTVSVNSAGVVELDQIRAVRHPDASNPDDGVLLNKGLINLVASITDADGDTQTASVDASGYIRFEDDAPALSSEEGSITLDNSQFSNLVLNGSFEDITGHRVSGSGSGTFIGDTDIPSADWVGMQSMVGWQLMSPTSQWMEPHDLQHAGVNTSEGDNYMDLGESVHSPAPSGYSANTHIGQIIGGLVDNTDYRLSFAFHNKAEIQENLASGEMQVIWNGQVVASTNGQTFTANGDTQVIPAAGGTLTFAGMAIVFGARTAEGWQSATLTVNSGEDATHRLEFKETGEIGDNWGMAIDSVSMVAETVIHTVTIDDAGLTPSWGNDGKGSFELGTLDGWTASADQLTLSKAGITVAIDPGTGTLTITQTGEQEALSGIPVVMVDKDGDRATATVAFSAQEVPDSLPQQIFVNVQDVSTVDEGGMLTHRVLLVDDQGHEVRVPDGEYVEVTLAYSPSATNGATQNTDYSAQTVVRIYGGTSGTYVFNTASTDNVDESSESYVVSVGSVTTSGVLLAGATMTAGSSATGTIVDTTPDVNVAPETAAASGSGLEDAVHITVALSGSDSDGTVASFRIASLPAGGTLYADAAHTQLVAAGGTVSASGNAATVYFVPAPDYNGTATFNYAAIDNSSLLDATAAVATITVIPVDDLVAGDDRLLINTSNEVAVPEWALLDNDTGSASPDITGIVAGSVDSLASVKLSSPAGNVLVDDEGSGTRGGSFDYTAVGGSGGSDTAEVTVVRNLGGDITGSAQNEVIVDGSSGAHDLYGEGGRDILIGNDGNDRLLGGTGSDILAGGSGADTFEWNLNDASVSATVDVIKDFSKANGDVLDLQDLLQGEHSTTVSDNPWTWWTNEGHAANLETYLSFSQSGANTVLTVLDTNGIAAGGNSQTIVFENTNLFSQYGAAAGDSNDLVAKMLAANALKTDA